MGQYINKKTVVDAETGEIISDNNWIGYDGFNEKGYRYRSRAMYIRYYSDSIPPNLSEDAYMLLFMIEELANEDNVLVRRVERKSKFSSIIYYPLDKDEIRTSTKYIYGINKFDKAWKELTRKCLKKIRYYTYICWAINPAIMYKCRYIPFWLYEEFQDSMNPYLSARTIKKLQQKIHDYN